VNSGSTQDQICDSTAAAMAAAGWSVVRVPARQSGGVHYTYTNVVMCNDLVLIPMYTNSVISPYNAQALAAWQAAAPGKTITQVNSQAIVSAAGVLHCIVMHVPAPMGGSNPTLYLRNLRGGETLEPGQQVAINWIADDDAGVSSVDILLSTDSGATFDAVIAGAAANDGEHVWTVPDVYAPGARLRLVARDADGNLGSDESDSDILINGAAPCPGDVDGSGNVDLTDVSLLLSAFGTCFGEAGYQPAADLTEDGCVALDDLSVQLASFGEACP
jgi:hypothetical protein